MLEAVIFDSDGLLFDSERIVQIAWNVAGNRLGYGNIGEQIVHTLGCNRVWREAYFRKIYGEDFPAETFQAYNREAFYEYVQAHGIPTKPGVQTLLEFLKEKKIPMAVATSASRDYAQGNLERAGLLPYFQGLLCGDMVTKGKPDPEIYLKSCQMIGADPQRCLALEDAPKGLESAHRAGLKTIMIPDMLPYTEAYAPYVTAHFPRLDAAIPFISQLLEQKN
jgi:HAD superfamily hydrolase (TIGR01509 family)